MAKANKDRQAEFVKWMGPIVEALRKLGGSGRPREVTDLVAQNEKVPDDKLEEIMQSGTLKFPNQVAWARQYLVWEGILDSSIKGTWVLTEKGYHSHLTYEESRLIFLKWVEIFAEARKDKTEKELETEFSQPDLPEIEKIESVYNPTLLEVLQSVTPDGFERLCQRLLRELDFEEVEVTKKSHDGGIDGVGVLRINPLVSFRVLFQCKRYKGSVSSEQVQAFQGAVQGEADKGLILTTGTFTRDAIKVASKAGKTPIELIDGSKLTKLFEEIKLGVKPKTVYEVDLSFFEPYLEQRNQ